MEAATQSPSSTAIRPQPYAYLLTETDHEDIATLQVTGGISRPQATVLLVLHKYSKDVKVTSRWIERVADLRQPEVSIAIGELERAGLVTATEDRNLNKGRPVKVYHHAKGKFAGYIRGPQSRMEKLNKGAMAVNRIFAQGVPGS